MADETPSNPTSPTTPTDDAAPAQPVPAAPGKPEAAAPAEANVTLEEIYARYNPVTPSPPAVPQQAAQPPNVAPEQTYAADPIEPTAADLKKKLDALEASLAEERGLNARERRRISLETQQRDMQDAIEQLATRIDVPNKNLIRYALAHFWENNPVFQQIWEQRSVHPKMFKDALNKVVPTIQAALEVKSDPDLVQKQMAMDHATKSIGSEPVAPKTEGERLAAMSAGEFSRYWATHGGRIQ